MAGYLPDSDLAFVTWIDRFVAYLGLHFAKFGLVEADLDQLTTLHPQWETALKAHQNARLAAKNACTAKNDKRDELSSVVRALAKRINAAPATTDADRESLGLKTKPEEGGSISSTSMQMVRPSAVIEISPGLRHILRVEIETPTGTQRGKPAGAIGCEVWHAVGNTPPSDGDLKFVKIVSRNPLTVDYPAAEAGKTAYYRLRWVNLKGDTSLWSELESATIAA